MNVLPNRLAALRRRSDGNLIAFLHTDLDMDLTLAGVAITRRDMGSETWKQSAQHAEDAYSEAARYLTDPKHSGRMPDEQKLTWRSCGRRSMRFQGQVRKAVPATVPRLMRLRANRWVAKRNPSNLTVP